MFEIKCILLRKSCATYKAVSHQQRSAILSFINESNFQTNEMVVLYNKHDTTMQRKRPIFIMGIPILVRGHFNVERAPRCHFGVRCRSDEMLAFCFQVLQSQPCSATEHASKTVAVRYVPNK